MTSERIVFTDHDGTLTDSTAEMEEYSSIVREYNARVLGMKDIEMELLMEAAKGKILRNPGDYGWERGKDRLIVAAATCDHYIFNQTVTVLVLDELTKEDGVEAKIIEGLGGREEYINKMFAECAPKLGIFYRPEAKEFLEELAKTEGIKRWAVVTNSGADKVKAKLDTLKLGFEPYIVGGAKKYEVDREWTALLPRGPYKGFPGFPSRGVELQRKTFYEVLNKETEGKMGGIVFIEDVAEFVLWLDFLAGNDPDFGDVKTALVLTPMTPEWEKKRYTDGSPERFGSKSLLDILDRIQTK